LEAKTTLPHSTTADKTYNIAMRAGEANTSGTSSFPLREYHRGRDGAECRLGSHGRGTTMPVWKNGFAAAKALVAANAVPGGASDGGAIAVLEAYHAGLVPPVCLSAVKSFFDGLQ
jgi:hypothetical protein